MAFSKNGIVGNLHHLFIGWAVLNLKANPIYALVFGQETGVRRARIHENRKSPIDLGEIMR